MKSIKRMPKNGFTLIELITVLVIIGFLIVLSVTVVGVGIMGNEWYTEDGVLRQIQADNPEAEKVLYSQRNVFSYSVIVVQMKDGSKKDYYLDSNILFSYELKPK